MPERAKSEKCEKCGKLFTKQGYSRHKTVCDGSSSIPEKEELVPVENNLETKTRMISAWEQDIVTKPVVIFKKETAADRLMNNFSEHLPEILAMLTPVFGAAAEAIQQRISGSESRQEVMIDTSDPLPSEQVVVADEPKKPYFDFSRFA